MNKFYYLALGLSLTACLAGCKKDDVKPNGPTLTANETLLTAKNWRITAVIGTTTFLGQTITTDGYPLLKTCQKDNFVKYNADKTAVSDEGATRCSTNDPQTSSFTWSFNAAENELTATGPVNGTTQTVKAAVLELTATTLRVRTTNEQTQGGYTITSTATTTYASF
ncbi:hypothetical protein [Hymenobacter swuensis]|uniref:Lipocalin-like domain-containing protein n=1 Tax=Hymenobacter swuensis DY53 TaxID=1227739 RepID=W8EWK8_9BACT|nr:hypothetical protein [Hymenobacter swuensis]AHJ96172.1 hypothetical protein Hsw_0577 [Hymenobacter swuensis DY53]